MIDEVVILNIREATERLKMCCDALKKHNVPKDIIRVHYSVLQEEYDNDTAFVEEYASQIFREFKHLDMSNYYDQLSNGLGHLVILKYISQGNKNVLVLEDDILLNTKWQTINEYAGHINIHASENDNLLFAQFHWWRWEDKPMPTADKIISIAPFYQYHFNGCWANLFSPSAAKYFLDCYFNRLKATKIMDKMDLFFHDVDHKGYAYISDKELFIQNALAKTSFKVPGQPLNRKGI